MKIFLASCVILDDYSRILLLHRSGEGLTQWELPGGKIGPNETAETAAVREIDKELGIKVSLVKALGFGEFEDEQNSYHYTWFQAGVVDTDPSLRGAEKFDDLDYFDLEDLPSLALSANMQALFDKILSGEVALRS